MYVVVQGLYSIPDRYRAEFISVANRSSDIETDYSGFQKMIMKKKNKTKAILTFWMVVPCFLVLFSEHTIVILNWDIFQIDKKLCIKEIVKNK